jgi:hypothetical protein
MTGLYSIEIYPGMQTMDCYRWWARSLLAKIRSLATHPVAISTVIRLGPVRASVTEGFPPAVYMMTAMIQH